MLGALSGDHLAGEVKHLVKAREHCEGVDDRLISAGGGEAIEPAGNRVNGRARFEVDPHSLLERVRIAAGILCRTTRNRPQRRC
jgi:hypothetical protein